MIFKEKADFTPSDKFEKAGHEAERKVAYYLRMAFGDEPRLLILNDLRLEFEDGITAQMDHLLIHQFGLIIIESKSIAGKLQVKDDGQWMRWYHDTKTGKDRSLGMQNPIKQARLQGQTLQHVLLKSATEDTRKMLENFPVDVLVTISDAGVFLAHDRSLYPEVCKADQVEEKIKHLVLERAATSQPNSFRLSEANKLTLAEYLVKIHRPYSSDHKETYAQIPNTETVRIGQKVFEYVVRPDTPKSFITSVINATKPRVTWTQHACRKCHSANLEIRYAKNYFFKCLDCDTNSRIEANCPRCNRLLKVRKDKNQFFVECSACQTSELFHVNK